jgi:hypothetical protein
MLNFRIDQILQSSNTWLKEGTVSMCFISGIATGLLNLVMGIPK